MNFNSLMRNLVHSTVTVLILITMAVCEIHFVFFPISIFLVFMMLDEIVEE